MLFGKTMENIKKLADFEKTTKKLEQSWKSQRINSYDKCSTMTLLLLFHSDTYDYSTVRLLRLFHTYTVLIVP